MRIGIFGNTNNYPLLLALGLRELGHDAVLVVNRKERVHRPEAKYPELAGGYPNWIVDCSDLPEDDFVAVSPRIGEVLNALVTGSAGLVLNDLGPSLLEFCGGLPAVSLMTGSDLSQYANPSFLRVREQGWGAEYAQSAGARLVTRTWERFIARQRAGLLASAVVSAPLPGLVPEIDDLLGEIGVPVGRRDFFYMADVEQSDVSEPGNSRLRIVNGARLNWRRPLPPGFSSQDDKGTDVLLEGFAQFVADGGDAELVLFRKGLDVADTERLAASLGIAGHIAWRDEVSLRDFHRAMAEADVVCDQLRDSFPGMVALDAMARGRPVIANFHPELMTAYFGEPVAACQARTAAEVAQHLRVLAAPSARAAAGDAARRFAVSHLSPAATARKCLLRLGVLPPGEHERERMIQRLNAAGAAAAIDSVVAGVGAAERDGVWESYHFDGGRFHFDEGHCWIRNLPPSIPGGDAPGEAGATAILLEHDPGAGGHAPRSPVLGPARAAHDVIRTQGRGRYSHWGPRLFFSTSDNTDPNTNGRRYSIVFRRDR